MRRGAIAAGSRRMAFWTSCVLHDAHLRSRSFLLDRNIVSAFWGGDDEPGASVRIPSCVAQLSRLDSRLCALHEARSFCPARGAVGACLATLLRICPFLPFLIDAKLGRIITRAEIGDAKSARVEKDRRHLVYNLPGSECMYTTCCYTRQPSFYSCCSHTHT